MAAGQSGTGKSSPTLIRVASALVLGPAAIGAAWFGSWPFLLFWLVAALVVLFEWTTLSACGRPAFAAGAAALIAAGATMFDQRPLGAILVLGLGALLAAGVASTGKRAWAFAGVIYAGVLLLAPVVLRADPQWGLAAVFVVFAIVWTTDILGYFAGRALGGPKLAPAASPSKTWSGAVAGTLGAVLLLVLGAPLVPQTPLAILVAGTALLSIVAQGGDLAESSLKRYFGAKDASRLIPGHGGVMDRLDGFWAAVLVAVMIGLARGGIAEPARGLLVW